jgi:hypothetical protein
MRQQVRRKAKFSFINQAAVRQQILDYADRLRPGQHTRVGLDVFDTIDRQIEKWIRAIVQNADPSKRTIR